ncbi:MAG: cytochrome C oxidase subunit IV [Gammaproteobacteria bacterium]|nr:cytochrome C oxidase subunit IV [Gammaproteobacteria bacterium]|tara:strand:+ start:2628 stop:2984 length:357 start_codon:yes stop_codon:yes gene_type:complete
MASTASGQQQHPLGLYLKIWILLFVLSAFSYMVDYYDVQGFWRWTLVLFFMVLKSGFILAIFMHVVWERMALALTILGPPLILLLLIFFMAFEGNYTQDARVQYFGHDADRSPLHVEH